MFLFLASGPDLPQLSLLELNLLRLQGDVILVVNQVHGVALGVFKLPIQMDIVARLSEKFGV